METGHGGGQITDCRDEKVSAAHGFPQAWQEPDVFFCAATMGGRVMDVVLRQKSR